jgi:hypothetical protein
MFDPMARKPPEQAKNLLDRLLYQNVQRICHEKEVLSFQRYSDIHWDVKELHDHGSRIEGFGCPNSFPSVNKEKKRVTPEETQGNSLALAPVLCLALCNDPGFLVFLLAFG